MYLIPDIPLQNRLIKWSRYLIITVLAIAVAILSGWQLNVPFLIAPLNKVVAVNPVTAACLILSCLSFLLLVKKTPSRSQITIGYLLAAIILFVAIMKLLALSSLVDIGIDEILFREKLIHPANENVPAFMALFTAVAFFLMAIALFTIKVETQKQKVPTQLIAVAIGLIGWLSILGYVYQENAFSGMPHSTPMALPTAICFMFLSMALLFSSADKAVMRQFTSTFAGGVTARFLIPAAIIVPAFLGLARLYGNRAGWYTHDFGVAVFAVAITAVLLILVWYNTINLNRRDIAKKMAEMELEKSIEQNAYLASLLANTNDAVFSMDNSFVIKSWNRAAELLYGYTAEEAIGKSTMDLIKTKINDSERLAIRESLRKIGVSKIEVVNYNKHGDVLDLMISTTATKNPEGETLGYVSICHDISERKKLEEQLQKTNAELEAFTYSVSHDLRAPLRGIIGFTAILEEEYSSKLDSEAMRITSVIKSNALRMGNLIDDLLNFSRLGRHEIIKGTVDMEDMVKQVVAELDNKANERPVKWMIHPLPDAQADINTIKQVWINLIDNAIKYSRNNEQPVIEIGTVEKEGEQAFFIKDNGVGFDQQYAGKLFKVFQRLHSMHEFEGTGVGLALVEKIISRHGGRIWAEAELNKGATFYFTL